MESEGGTKHLLAAFASGLMAADSMAFEGEIVSLVRIAHHLVGRVDPKATVLTPEAYEDHQINLRAAYRVMLTIQGIAPGQLDPGLEGGVYQRLKKVLDEIVLLSRYYPYRYHAELVKHSLAGMEIKVDGGTERKRMGRRMIKGMYGALRVAQGFREIAELKFDAEAIKDGFQSILEALRRYRISKAPWCNLIEKLDYGCMSIVQQPAYAEGLFDSIDQLIEESSSYEHSGMLRFGIVEELIALISDSRDQSVQTDAFD